MSAWWSKELSLKVVGQSLPPETKNLRAGFKLMSTAAEETRQRSILRTSIARACTVAAVLALSEALILFPRHRASSEGYDTSTPGWVTDYGLVFSIALHVLAWCFVGWFQVTYHVLQMEVLLSLLGQHKSVSMVVKEEAAISQPGPWRTNGSWRRHGTS